MLTISRQFLQKAAVFHQQGQLAACVKQCDLVLAVDPKNFDALHLKGLALYQLGALGKSLQLLTKAIRQNTNSALSYNNRGLVYQRAGRKNEALSDFGRAISLNGSLAEAHCNKGNVLREMMRLGDAADACLTAISLNPAVAEFHNSLGVVRKGQSSLKSALDCFEKALALRPHYVDALINKANVLKELERLDEALAIYERAIALRPDHAEAHSNRGHALREWGRLDEAFASYERAVSLKPDHVRAWLGLAKIDLELGRFKEAEESYEKVIELAPDLSEPLYGMAWVKKFAADDPLISTLEERLSDSRLSDEDRTWLHPAYAKICNDLGRYDDAIAHYSLGKSLLKSKFSIDQHCAAHSALKRFFTPQFFTDRKNFGLPDERPVFIVGMPRSGTTLTEQILASHNLVEGLGELLEMSKIADQIGGGLRHPDEFTAGIAKLQADDIAKMAERYREAYIISDARSIRLVDKMPHNFQLLGLIALMFPNARVVHCRRNPLDTCLSIYLQRYIENHDYANDFTTLGKYYRDYEALMMHWREVIPIPIYDCVYEELIGAFEKSAEAMVSFLGLEWDPNCLNYYQQDRPVRTASLWQVRQPLYDTSLERWRHYEKHLGPLKDALGLS